MNGSEASGGTNRQSRILVVDDEPTNRVVVRAHLDKQYEIIEAEDGPSALMAFDEQTIDLAVLDVRMPGFSGYDLCRELKQRAANRYLPVLMLTALDNREARAEGLEAGADDFLTKPLDPRELKLRISCFLKLRRQDRTIHEQLEHLQHYQSLNDSLFSLIIHDLRNPLGCVEAYIRMAQDELGEVRDKTPREYLQRAYDSAHELGDLLEEVVKVRHLEEGKLPMDKQPVVLRMLIREAIELAQPTARAMNVRILMDGEANQVLPLDHALTLCSIQNLLTNAITFSSEEDTVTVKVVSDASGSAIEISDHGPGVPDELKGDLFEKFGSVEAWRGAARRGLGLGLHLVKLVANAHGGHVSVCDGEGGGSVFRLYLPNRDSSPIH